MLVLVYHSSSVVIGFFLLGQIGNERCRAPEILFSPILVGLEYPGVHELLVSAITRADLDLRKTLYSQIVLSGGSTFFNGFGDRLLNEVRKMAPKDTKVREPKKTESLLVGYINSGVFLNKLHMYPDVRLLDIRVPLYMILPFRLRHAIYSRRRRSDPSLCDVQM